MSRTKLLSKPCDRRENYGIVGKRDLVSNSNEAKFESVVMQHLDAAYNLARWLLRNDHDAEDVVQDAAVKAFDSLDSFRGGDGKAWFLTVVRNTCLNRIRQRNAAKTVPLEVDEPMADSRKANPEEQVIRAWQGEAIMRAMNELSETLLEVVILRELEGLSYKEISDVIGAPIGTVMSRLSRARQRLQLSLVMAEAVECK